MLFDSRRSCARYLSSKCCFHLRINDAVHTLVCHYCHREIGLALLLGRQFSVADCLKLCYCTPDMVVGAILHAPLSGSAGSTTKCKNSKAKRDIIMAATGTGRVGSWHGLTISVALLVLNVSLAFPEHAYRTVQCDAVRLWNAVALRTCPERGQ